MNLPTFEQLPNELISLIVAAGLDLDSTWALASTSRQIYALIKTDEVNIAYTILCNQIGSQNLPVAISVRTIDDGTVPNPWQVIKFFEDETSYMQAFRLSCNLAIASEMLKTHRTVEFLATCMAHQFLETAAHKFELCGLLEPMKSREMSRIVRAIYMLDMFFRCLALPRINMHPACEIRWRTLEENEVFWTIFAPWELEQMACVHDFLVRALIRGISMPIELDLFDSQLI
jgi:hypothetical protein